MSRTKQLLISEWDGMRNVLVSERVYTDMLSRSKVLARPITNKEVKERHDITTLSDAAYFRELMLNTYNAKVFDAEIKWFDGLRGEGMVKLVDGTTLYCHFSAIDGIDKNNWHWPRQEDVSFLNNLKGRRCRVVPYISFGYAGVERLELVN